MTDREKPTYTCPCCKAKSWNPNDGLHRYCGACGAFKGKGIFIWDGWRPANPALRRKVEPKARVEGKSDGKA